MGNVSNVAKRNKVLDLVRRFSGKNSSRYQPEGLDDDQVSRSVSCSSDYEDVCTLESSGDTSNASLQFDEAIWLFSDSDQETANEGSGDTGDEARPPTASNGEGFDRCALRSSPTDNLISAIPPSDANALNITLQPPKSPTPHCSGSRESNVDGAGSDYSVSATGSVSEPVKDLKTMFDAVLNMDTDFAEENYCSSTAMSEASGATNGQSGMDASASARLGAGDQRLSPEIASSRSPSFTSGDCSVHEDYPTQTSSNCACAAALECPPEPVDYTERVGRFDTQHVDITSSMNAVLNMYEPFMDKEMFATASLTYMRKLLLPSDIEYAFRSGVPVKIGSGEFGDVYVGRMVEGGNFVAIKALKKDRTDITALLQEAFIMLLASDTEFAPQYHGLVPIGPLGAAYQKVGLVCEFVGDALSLQPSDFRHALKDLQNKQAVDKDLQIQWLDVCLRMATAISKFHALGILLNDIKTDNILLRQRSDDFLEPVFIDFGLASIGEGITLAIDLESQTKEEIMKEYSHIAPEVLFGGQSNTISDVYSFGKVLIQISDPLQVRSLTEVASRCVDMEPLHRATFQVILDVISSAEQDMMHPPMR